MKILCIWYLILNYKLFKSKQQINPILYSSYKIIIITIISKISRLKWKLFDAQAQSCIIKQQLLMIIDWYLIGSLI